MLERFDISLNRMRAQCSWALRPWKHYSNIILSRTRQERMVFPWKRSSSLGPPVKKTNPIKSILKRKTPNVTAKDAMADSRGSPTGHNIVWKRRKRRRDEYPRFNYTRSAFPVSYGLINLANKIGSKDIRDRITIYLCIPSKLQGDLGATRLSCRPCKETIIYAW